MRPLQACVCVCGLRCCIWAVLFERLIIYTCLPDLTPVSMCVWLELLYLGAVLFTKLIHVIWSGECNACVQQPIDYATGVDVTQ